MTATPITAAQFAQAKALEAKATYGPWHPLRTNKYNRENVSNIVAGSADPYSPDSVPIVETDAGHYPPCVADGEFIADARTSLPAALAWIEKAVPLLRVLAQQHDIPSWRREPVRQAEALIAGFEAITSDHPDFSSHGGFPPCPAPPER